MKITILLLLASIFVGCSTNQISHSASECDLLGSEEEQYKCYLLDIRYAVNSEIESHIKNSRYILNSGNLIGNPKVGFKLNIRGEVDKIELIETSGDARIDNILIQSIQYSGPFKLPKNDSFKKKLMGFTWAIQI